MIMQEKLREEEIFNKEKEKIDKVLEIGVISDEEYQEKINTAGVRTDNFEEIKQQYELGIIDSIEDRKINY